MASANFTFESLALASSIAWDDIKVSVVLVVFAILGFAALSDDFQTLGEEENEQVEQQASACSNKQKATPDFQYKPTSPGVFHGWLYMLCTPLPLLVAVPVVDSCMSLEFLNTALQTLDGAAKDNIKLSVVLLIFAVLGLVAMSDDFQTLAEEEDEQVEQQVSACSNIKVATPDLQYNPTSPGMFRGWHCILCLTTLAIMLVAVPVVASSMLSLELWNTALQTLDGGAGDNIQLSVVLLIFVTLGFVAMRDDFQTLSEQEDEKVEQQVAVCSNNNVATPDMHCNLTSQVFHVFLCMLCLATLAMVFVADPVVESSVCVELWNTALQTLDGAAEDDIKLSVVLLSFAMLGFLVMRDDLQTLAEEEDEQVEQQVSACSNHKVATPDLQSNPTSSGLVHGWLCMLCLSTLAMVLIALPLVDSSALLKLCNTTLQLLDGAALENVTIALLLLIFLAGGLAAMWDDFQTFAEEEESACNTKDSGHYVTSMFASACIVLLGAVLVAARGGPQEQLQAVLDLLGLVSCRGVAIVAALLSLAAANVRSLEPMLKGSSKESGWEQCSAAGVHKLAQ